MHITARIEYALRALLALAAVQPRALTSTALAETQLLPLTFLQAILTELRRADLVVLKRGPERGYRLNRPPEEITVGLVIRVLDGTPAESRAAPPAGEAYDSVRSLRQVWKAADTALLDVIDAVSLADLLDGSLPEHVRDLITRE
ncbi:MAG: Rrf2 family transcriptional regulator [Streptosporangiaceae bacterium]